MQPDTLVPFYIETASCWSKVEPRQYKTFSFTPNGTKSIHLGHGYQGRLTGSLQILNKQLDAVGYDTANTHEEKILSQKKKPISCQMSHNYLQKDLQVNVWDIITLTIYASLYLQILCSTEIPENVGVAETHNFNACLMCTLCSAVWFWIDCSLKHHCHSD